MFSKKKKEQPSISYDYTKWESDFGFLILMINRKVGIVNTYDINAFSQILQDKNDFIHDKDIEEIYTQTVNEVYSSLSEKYTAFLIDKYFGTEKALITFIAEAIKEDLTKSAIDANNTKINKQYTQKNIEKLNQLNKITLNKKGN